MIHQVDADREAGTRPASAKPTKVSQMSMIRA